MSSKWQKIHDPASGSDYYYDTITGASQWEAPTDYAPQQQPTPTETQTQTKNKNKTETQPVLNENPQTTTNTNSATETETETKTKTNTNTNKAGAKVSQGQRFIPSASFVGSKEGYVFKRETDGVGYYLDAPALHSQTEAQAQTEVDSTSGAKPGQAAAASSTSTSSTTDVERRGDWSKHYDENSKHYYWYNDKTGESKWVTEEPLPPLPGIDQTQEPKPDAKPDADAGADAELSAPMPIPVSMEESDSNGVRVSTDAPTATSVPASGVEESSKESGLESGKAAVSNVESSGVAGKSDGGVEGDVGEIRVSVAAESGVGLRVTREETAKMLTSWLPAEVRNAPSIEYKNVRQGDRGYDATATFGKDGGGFDHASGKSYWERQGKPGDKAGRQMSYYYDLDALDKNRKEAQEKKRRLQQDKSIDWKAYAQKQKKKRFLARNQWLFED